jgi:hypothetical protein
MLIDRADRPVLDDDLAADETVSVDRRCVDGVGESKPYATVM